MACFLGADDPPALLGADEPGTGIPVYVTPEPAARALGRAAIHAEWRRQPPGALPELAGLDIGVARSIVQAFLERSRAGGEHTARHSGGKHRGDGDAVEGEQR